MALLKLVSGQKPREIAARVLQQRRAGANSLKICSKPRCRARNFRPLTARFARKSRTVSFVAGDTGLAHRPQKPTDAVKNLPCRICYSSAFTRFLARPDSRHAASTKPSNSPNKTFWRPSRIRQCHFARLPARAMTKLKTSGRIKKFAARMGCRIPNGWLPAGKDAGERSGRRNCSNGQHAAENFARVKHAQVWQAGSPLPAERTKAENGAHGVTAPYLEQRRRPAHPLARRRCGIRFCPARLARGKPGL